MTLFASRGVLVCEPLQLRLVQATLGHASLDTTSKYLHIRPSESSGDYL